MLSEIEIKIIIAKLKNNDPSLIELDLSGRNLPDKTIFKERD